MAAIAPVRGLNRSVERSARRVPAIALGLLLLVALAGCGAPDHARSVRLLEELFPVLERLRVTELTVKQQCEYIEYSRGAFLVGDPYDCWPVDDPRQIDAQAREAIDEIIRDSERLGRRLRDVSAEFDSDGRIARESGFRFDTCTWYYYDPGYSSLPFDDSEPYAEINVDWYMQESASFSC